MYCMYVIWILKSSLVEQPYFLKVRAMRAQLNLRPLTHSRRRRRHTRINIPHKATVNRKRTPHPAALPPYYSTDSAAMPWAGSYSTYIYIILRVVADSYKIDAMK